MSHQDLPPEDEGKLDAFIEEMKDRQRNVAFPDTARNAGVFYRSLPAAAENGPLLVRIGIWIVLLTLIASGFGIVYQAIRYRPMSLIIFAILITAFFGLDSYLKRRH